MVAHTRVTLRDMRDGGLLFAMATVKLATMGTIQTRSGHPAMRRPGGRSSWLREALIEDVAQALDGAGEPGQFRAVLQQGGAEALHVVVQLTAQLPDGLADVGHLEGDVLGRLLHGRRLAGLHGGIVATFVRAEGM